METHDQTVSCPSEDHEQDSSSTTDIVELPPAEEDERPSEIPQGRDTENAGGGSLPANSDTKLYDDFIASSTKLENSLQDFSQKILKLGSAQGLSSDSLGVKYGLVKMREYFEADDKVLPDREKGETTKQKNRKYKLNNLDKERGGRLAGTVDTDLSVSLRKLSESLREFAIGLTHFDDYYEWKTSSAIDEFRTEVLILSEALAYFSSDIHRSTPELKRFIETRLSTASDYNNRASAALNRFVKTGIPCISDAQSRSSNMMLNSSTVATFFAGFAATALQYAGIDLDTTVGKAIQALWLSALVLSIGSAVTSFLVVAWRQAIFSSTPPILPWCIRFWMRSGYIILLTIAIMTFVSGLVAYVYTLQRAGVIFWAVTSCTVFCAISLAILSVYFALDYRFFSEKRKKDRPSTQQGPYISTVSPNSEKKQSPAGPVPKNRSLTRFSMLRHEISTVFHRKLRFLWNSGYIFPYVGDEFREMRWRVSRNFRPKTKGARGRFLHSIMRILLCCVPEYDLSLEEGTNTESTGLQSDPKKGFAAQEIESLFIIKEQRKHDSSYFFDRKRIYDMQFSPCGAWLAVCTTVRCYITDPELKEIHLVPCSFIRQVKWSPNGHRLLTRTGDSFQIWRFNGKTFFYEDIVEIDRDIVDVEWLNDDNFVALSNNAESLFSVRVKSDHPLEIRLLPSGLTIYEMTTISSRELILFLATRNILGLPKENGISCIIVYDMKPNTAPLPPKKSEKTLERLGKFRCKIPLSKKAIGLTVSGDKKRFVLTYKGSMPEVWEIIIVDESITISWRSDLQLKTKKNQAVWGSASFVGSDGYMVACAEDDIIHFWKDENHTFEFKHFHSLRINESPVRPSPGREVDDGSGNNDSNGDSESESDYSDYDSDWESDGNDQGKKERTVFAWKPASELPTVATGNVGKLKLWAPRHDEVNDTETNKA